MGIPQHIIYGLIDPTTLELRYIGRSSSGLRRPRSHWENEKTLKRRDPCHCWVRSVISSGSVPLIEILDEFTPSEGVSAKLDLAECFWIASVRASGGRLMNMTDGGDSLPDNRGVRNWMFGRVHPSKGKKLDLTVEQRERRASPQRNHGSRPMTAMGKESWMRAVKGRKHSAETKRRMRESALRRWGTK